MCDNQMICDILWEGGILLLSPNLRFKLHRAQETQTHMWKKRLRRRQLSHPHPSATAIYADQTCFAPYFLVLPSLTLQSTLVPTVSPNENKQPLARRDSRKPFVFTKWIWGEQVCFAGSGCLPLCRLGPGPWAVSGPGEAGGRGEERRGGWQRHGRTGSQNTRRFTGGPFATLPSPGWRHQASNAVDFPNTEHTSTMENTTALLHPCLP